MRVLVVLILLSQSALADGAPAIFSVLAVGGPLAPVFAIIWAYRRTKDLSTLSRWCGLVFSVPAAVGAFNLSFTAAFRHLAGTALGLFCGPFILLCSLGAAMLPGALLRLTSAWNGKPKNDRAHFDSRSLLGHVIVGGAMLGSATALLYLALHTQPESHSVDARPQPPAEFVWCDNDLDPTKRTTVNRIALGMTYDEVVQLAGKPTCAWHRPTSGIAQRVFTESEVARLQAKGFVAFPTVATIRFNGGSAYGRTHVDFDTDGRAIQIYGGSLEIDGNRIATEESAPPWLPPLKQALPPADDLHMTSHQWRSYYYRGLGLKINVSRRLTFSLHSERLEREY